VKRKWQFLLFYGFFFTQQYSWAQDQVEFFLSDTRDINANAFNSSGVSLVHFLFGLMSFFDGAIKG
jgi:hypothetical protein